MQKRRIEGYIHQMDRDISRLRQEAKDMFSPHQFAKSAKLERQANALEKKKGQLQKQFPSTRVKNIINVVKVCAISASSRCSTATKINFLTAPLVSVGLGSSFWLIHGLESAHW